MKNAFKRFECVIENENSPCSQYYLKDEKGVMRDAVQRIFESDEGLNFLASNNDLLGIAPLHTFVSINYDKFADLDFSDEMLRRTLGFIVVRIMELLGYQKYRRTIKTGFIIESSYLFSKKR